MVIGSIFVILLIILIVLLSFAWIFALIDILRSDFKDPSSRIIWFLFVLFSHFLGTIVYMKDLGEKSPTRGLSGWFKITSEFYTPNKEDFNKYENWKPYIWEDRKEDFNIGGKNEWKSVRFEYINNETNSDANIDTNLNDEDEFYHVKDNVVQARIIFPKTNEDEEGKKLEDDCNIK